MSVVCGRPMGIQFNVRYVRYDVSELCLPLRLYFVNKSQYCQLSFNRDLTPSALGSSLHTYTTDLRWSTVLRGGSGFSEDLGSGDAEGTRWKRVTESPTGTGCSLGSRGLWSSSGIGKGTCGFFRDSWRKGGVSAISWLGGEILHLSQED